MIEFIKPYFDPHELNVFQNKEAPPDFHEQETLDGIRQFFPSGSLMLADSGEEAIRATVELIKSQRGWKQPTIAIPTVICGSVYRAVKDLGHVILMDADETWNCRPDPRTDQADILFFASLSGKRMPVPERARPDQILVDDSAQCFDGVCGMRAQTDYSIFSFGNGKQMYAGGGGAIFTAQHDLSPLSGLIGRGLGDWQKSLMRSQLDKITEINKLRRENGQTLIEVLKDLPWMKLPDPQDHVFSKFVLFITQEGQSLLEPERTREITTFIRHMAGHGVQVEETYIPLHIRFPRELSEERYLQFKANRLWAEAITLPCRPNLSMRDLGQIVQAVRSYRPVTRPRPFFASNNRSVYESQYSSSDLKPNAAEDYFGKLHKIRMDMLLGLGRNKKILDVGCGSGAYMIPLLEKGMDVAGLDFSGKLLSELKEEWRQSKGGFPPLTLIHADACAIPAASESYDVVYSFSTLYYIPEPEKALAEIARVLRPGGLALLDMGSRRSLNTIEARRVSTGVRSFHISVGRMNKIFRKLSLRILERRCFQIFPLYGGGTSFAANCLNPLLRKYLASEVQGTLLDELVSSHQWVNRFAFRHLVLLKKVPVSEPTETDHSSITELQEIVAKSHEHDQERTRALESIAHQPAQSIKALVDLLAHNPSDVLTVLAIAKLFDGKEERRFVDRTLKMLDRAVGSPRSADYIDLSRMTARPPRFDNDKRAPRVSVILPTYNQASMLPKAVESVLRQTYRDFELIIVNDGSTDATTDILAKLRDSRIRVIQQENRRLPGALNTGFSNAVGEFLTWTSSDNICAPYFLEALVGALESCPQAGLAYADFFFVDKSDRILSRVTNPHYGYRSLMLRNDGNAAFLYRRSCQDRIGLYDPELEGAEDWDYWLRIAEHFPFVYVPEAVYFYRLHEQSMQNTKKDLVNRSAVRTIEKAWARLGGEINLEGFYPGLKKCSDQKSASFAAAFELGTRMLAARVVLQELPERLLKEATRIFPDSIHARINLSVALALSGKWAEALNSFPDLSETDEFRDLTSRIREAIMRRSPEELTRLRLPVLTPQGHELMSRESECRAVFSFTARMRPALQETTLVS